MRTGIIAKKIGMTQRFSDSGQQLPLTVVQVAPCKVIDTRNEAKHGYNAVVLAAFETVSNRLNKPQVGYFSKLKTEPYQEIKEFRVDQNEMLEPGTILTANHFKVGQFVDVTGVTIGKGFAGSMKRHNFGGLRASHGTSVAHRSHGSTGNRQDPGKVFKNKKMAGHMGATRVTKQNLKVVDVDQERGLIYLLGAVPGAKGNKLYIRDAVKKSN